MVCGIFNEENLKGEENVSGLEGLGTTADLPALRLSYNFKEQLSLLPDQTQGLQSFDEFTRLSLR